MYRNLGYQRHPALAAIELVEPKWMPPLVEEEPERKCRNEGAVDMPRRKRKRIEDGVDGRWRRQLQEDVELCAGKSLQLRGIPPEIGQGALASIGRRDTERWLFLELFAGCANLSTAVWEEACPAGLLVGPAIDRMERCDGEVPRLCLDLTTPHGQELVLALIKEAKPFWVHVAPDCRFWVQLGRLTARRTVEQWRGLREDALAQVGFSLHVCRAQSVEGRAASMEQPCRAASWRLDAVQSLQDDGFSKVAFPSCAWGMRDLDNGKPIKKLQAFTSNKSLFSLVRPCTCAGKHARLEGHFRGPHLFKGTRKSSWSGRYPPRLCQELAKIILGTWRASSV